MTGNVGERMHDATDSVSSVRPEKACGPGREFRVGSTAVVLISIDPILAAATLCTFPLIAWLTVFLRERLTHGFLHGGRAWAEMTSILAGSWWA